MEVLHFISLLFIIIMSISNNLLPKCGVNEKRINTHHAVALFIGVPVVSSRPFWCNFVLEVVSLRGSYHPVLCHLNKVVIEGGLPEWHVGMWMMSNYLTAGEKSDPLVGLECRSLCPPLLYTDYSAITFPHNQWVRLLATGLDEYRITVIAIFFSQVHRLNVVDSCCSLQRKSNHDFSR